MSTPITLTPRDLLEERLRLAARSTGRCTHNGPCQACEDEVTDLLRLADAYAADVAKAEAAEAELMRGQLTRLAGCWEKQAERASDRGYAAGLTSAAAALRILQDANAERIRAGLPAPSLSVQRRTAATQAASAGFPRILVNCGCPPPAPGACPCPHQLAAAPAALNACRPAAWDATPPGGWICAVPDPTRPDGLCGTPLTADACRLHGPSPQGAPR